MTGLPYMKLYVDDYEAATAHLTPEEDGIYTRLLRLCWRTPECSLPKDPEWIERKMRMKGDYDKKIQPILDEFFKLECGRWGQKKQLKIFHEAQEIMQAKIKAGRKGGLAKSLKTKERLALQPDMLFE